MKTIKLLVYLLVLPLLVNAQAPKGFNYQAVIRDVDGLPLVSQNVSIRLTLTNDTGTPNYFSEIHTTQTSPQGIVSLAVGLGTPQGQNTLDSVVWRDGNIWIKVEINKNDGGGYKTLGLTQIQSVPYAQYAVNGTWSNEHTVVSSSSAGVDDPIFEVKNKLNQVVFGVYQSGVRVYVEETKSKGAKGGFAVGGLSNQSKVTPTEYFRITPDSARIWVKEVPSLKGAKGGFAVGGLSNLSKAYTNRNLMFIAPDSARIYIDDSNIKSARGGFAIGGLTTQALGARANFFNIETKNNYIINPSQPRILWYPLKNAFLVGQVLIPHPDSVGINSFSSGYESMAKGSFSQAMGYKAIARGFNATAIGIQALAAKANSFALGESAKALNTNSFAFGTGSVASGTGSFAFGSVGRDTTGNVVQSLNTSASGSNAFAIGLGARAMALNAFSIGTSSTASSPNSTAIGFYSYAGGDFSLAINGGIATGKYSMAFRGIATGDNAIAFGPNSKASGINSFALGGGKWAATVGGKTYTEATGNFSYAMGYNSVASGNYSFSLGGGTTTLADYSFALGFGLTNNSYRSFVIGQFNELLGTGSSTWVENDPLFVVANGSISAQQVITPSNALTIFKNGDMMIKGNIYPKTDDLYNLGTLTNRWKTVFATNGVIQTSDARLKDKVVGITYGLTEILKLNPVSFHWKNSDDNETKLGFLAQDVKQIIKEAVTVGDDKNLTLGLNYTVLIPVLVKAIQEQQKTITDLQQQNNLLNSKVNELDAIKAELERLKSIVDK
jgi:hypothetical protein